MDILKIIEQAEGAASDYLALSPDQRPDVNKFVRDNAQIRFPDWRGCGLSDARFHQFELAFGLAVTKGAIPDEQ